eukprot:gb/GECH01000295.1/.p1 GENE.gb/GECH01000295.1/~~gb/GECH01000295.1/.p1  ORF type:complete len:206 (+),score=49.85 gb/GECH01000295.1/:1-618(+)
MPDQTKLVVRNLPETTQQQTLFDILNQESIDPNNIWFPPHSGNKNVYHLGYIHVNEKDVIRVKNCLEQHRFINDEGREISVRIEYAPYQRLPRDKPRHDERSNTIEDDKDYKAFLEELNRPVERNLPADRQLELQQEERLRMLEKHGGELPPETTPILEELNAKAKEKASSGSKGNGSPSGNGNKGKKRRNRRNRKSKSTKRGKD